MPALPVSTFPLVGFTGPRNLSSRFAPLVGSVVRAVQRAGRQVAVGDAQGADALVLAAARQGVRVALRQGRPLPPPQVFTPQRYGSRRVAGALAHRSSRLVSAVLRSGPGHGLVGFVAGPCPRHPRSGQRLVPSASSVQCFGGFRSGTWSTLAFAVAVRVPVVVFRCGPWCGALPTWWGGFWVPAGPTGLWVQGWRFVRSQRAQVGVPFSPPRLS